MMNLQRLEEVRNNLTNLVSIASLIGAQRDIEDEVKYQLTQICDLREVVFSPPKPRPEPKLEQPSKPSPRRTNHNHITRDIKKYGAGCPGCDEYHFRNKSVAVRTPEKFEIPPAPKHSRRVEASVTYNPDRYVPYKVLWAKVIIRAAYDYALWRDSKDLRLKKFAQDAERWLFEPSDIELSFETICASWDFPIERIRKRTRLLTKDDVKKLEFRERQSKGDIGVLDTHGDDE